MRDTKHLGMSNKLVVRVTLVFPIARGACQRRTRKPWIWSKRPVTDTTLNALGVLLTEAFLSLLWCRVIEELLSLMNESFLAPHVLQDIERDTQLTPNNRYMIQSLPETTNVTIIGPHSHAVSYVSRYRGICFEVASLPHYLNACHGSQCQGICRATVELLQGSDVVLSSHPRLLELHQQAQEQAFLAEPRLPLPVAKRSHQQPVFSPYPTLVWKRTRPSMRQYHGTNQRTNRGNSDAVYPRFYRYPYNIHCIDDRVRKTTTKAA